MHVLILGAAGMVGRKLVERLATEGHLGGRAIARVTLHDVVAPEPPAGAPFAVAAATSDISRPGEAERLVAERPDVDLPPRRDRLGRGRGGFRQGLPHQPRRHPRPVRGGAPDRRRLSPPPRLHLVHRRVRRALPRRHPRRFPPHAADELRHPEGDRRASAVRLHPPRHPRRRRHPPADDLRPPGAAEQGGLRLLLRHHPGAAGGGGGGAAGRRGRAPLARLAPLGDRVPPPRRDASRRADRPAAEPDHAGAVRHRRGADRGAAARGRGRARHGASAASPIRASRPWSPAGRAASTPAGRETSASRRNRPSTTSSASTSRTSGAAPSSPDGPRVQGAGWRSATRRRSVSTSWSEL